MAGLPSGTVTMLFSDIEGSTALLSRLGRAYADVLDAQRAILRTAWSDWDGVEMGTEGDSFFVVFEKAGDAVAAAVQGQQELARHPWSGGERVAVRMGLHTGEPTLHGGGYVGIDVHRAARVAAAVHGGQVVVSDTTRGLVVGGLPADVRLTDLGWHRLKDIAEPEHLFQVVADGLRSDFPPLRSLGTASSLPTPTTALVGRAGELRELSMLVRQPGGRLVTLTGPGGSGKSRLAVAVAAGLLEAFPDGVFFVPLAAVTSDEAMWTTLAEVVGVTGTGPARTRLPDYLRHRRLLLVLDNLEQLPGAAAVVGELVQAAPQLVIMATSRRPLHLHGEHEHPVPPLDLPASGELDAAERSGALQLFVQQARLVRPGFSLTEDNVGAVGAICRRLDGLPLAVELAAARSKLLSPKALLARLDIADGLRANDVDRPTRQRTLHAALAWSLDLLSPELLAFFRRLGVFAGGADLDAVAAVTADLQTSVDPLDQVAELVDVSLASISDGPDGEPRVSLLQTVAHHARAELAAAGELADTRQRHAEFYVRLAEALAPTLFTRDQLAARDRLEVEHDNLRQALSWTLGATGDIPSSGLRLTLGLRLAVTLAWFWERTGARDEARGWLRRAVELAGDDEGPELAAVLHGLGEALMFDGSDTYTEEVSQLLTRSLSIFRRLGDRRGIARALIALSWPARNPRPLAEVRAMLEEAITVSREVGDHVLLARATYRLGEVEIATDNWDRAIELVTEARDLRRQSGDEVFAAGMQDVLAYSMMRAGRIAEARDQLNDLVPTALRLGDVAVKIEVLYSYIALFVRLGDVTRAATALGAYEAFHERDGSPSRQADDDFRSRLAIIRAEAGVEVWERAREAGRRCDLDEALAAAREGATQHELVGPPTPFSPPRARWRVPGRAPGPDRPR